MLTNQEKTIPPTLIDSVIEDVDNCNDDIEIKSITSEIISCSSTKSEDSELIFIGASQNNPKLKLKHIKLTDIMTDLTEYEHIALTGESLRKRKLSLNSEKNSNKKMDKNIPNKKLSIKKKKTSTVTSSNYSISKYFKPISKSSSDRRSSTQSETPSTSIKSSPKNGSSNQKVNTNKTPTATITTPITIICLDDDVKIIDEEKYCINKKPVQLLPAATMTSIPLCNLRMINEFETYKVAECSSKSINNHEIGVKKSLDHTNSEIEQIFTKKNLITHNSCDGTLFSSGEHTLSMAGNSLVSFNRFDNNNSTKMDEIKMKNLSEVQQISTNEIIPKKLSIISSQKCPAYKIIEGTTFAVDGFRFGTIAGVTDYFLTHFHADHYIGLRKSFSLPLWTSKITARLVRSFIKVDEKFIRILEIDKPIFVNGIEIITLEANHCPGAVMFLFKLPDGRNILHTGDFRASAEMEMYPCFWNCNIDILYLDTTYLKKSYDFMSQLDSIDIVKKEVRKFLIKNIGKKYLIIVGAYIIGKEKVWKAIAECTKLKVWLDEKQYKASRSIFLPDTDQHILDMIVECKEDAAIHVLPMGKLSYPFLNEYLKDFDDHVMLAIKISGWEKHTKNSYGNRISIIGVEYSEHSSYSELERFVRYLKPKKVISTVPVSGDNLHKCLSVPDEWITWDVPKPMNKSYQRNITSYMKIN